MNTRDVTTDRVRLLEGDLKTVVGLCPGDRLELIGVAALPDRPVALGASEGTEGLHGQTLVRWVEGRPWARAIALKPPASHTSSGAGRAVLPGVLPLEIQCFEQAPNILVLQRLEGAAFVLEGDATITEWQPGALLVNLGMRARAVVHVVAADREAVLVGEPNEAGRSSGTVTAFSILRAVPEALADLSRWKSPTSPHITVDTRDLLHGETCEPWLSEQIEGLSRSPSTVDRSAAAGLLARLWLPPGEARRGDLSGRGEGPAHRVRAWAGTLDAAAIAHIEAVAVERAQSLAQDLAELQERAIDKPAGVAPLALRIVHARDDLESVAYVLDAARTHDPQEESALRTALQAFDREATTHLSELAFADGLEDDERVVAVCWREPDAWWGALGAS